MYKTVKCTSLTPSISERIFFEEITNSVKIQKIKIHQINTKGQLIFFAPNHPNRNEAMTDSSREGDKAAANDLHISSKSLSWTTNNSDLHLDDLQENSAGLDEITPGIDCKRGGLTAQSKKQGLDEITPGIGCKRGCQTESKRQEQLRLFKEYIECCQISLSHKEHSTLHNHSFSNLSMCDEDLCTQRLDRSESATAAEYGSFLPKTTIATRSRSSPAATVATSGLLQYTGRDTPAGSSPPSPPNERSPPDSADAESRKIPTPPTPPSSTCNSMSFSPRRGAARGTSAALRMDSDEGSVYRSQIASALGAGRLVWL